LNTLVAGFVVALLSLGTLPGCDKKEPPPPASNGTADDHGHDHGDDDNDAGHGGSVIQLGDAIVGSFEVSATRDEGEIVAGQDAPIDVTVAPAADSTAKVAAVRFWIGTEDAKSSVKARAEVEDASEPNRWHTHAEVPNPLPEDSKLWVEIEDEAGGTTVASFDLKR
jgi:hypothetical protein